MRDQRLDEARALLLALAPVDDVLAVLGERCDTCRGRGVPRGAKGYHACSACGGGGTRALGAQDAPTYTQGRGGEQADSPSNVEQTTALPKGGSTP